MLRSFADTSYRFASDIGTSSNPPLSIAKRLGLRASRHLYTWNGGNMPQYLVNLFCEQIARGDMQAALICGGEALRTQHGVQRAGLPVSWDEDPGGAPELIGDPRRGWSDHEELHRLRAAITFYPLFENGIRGARGAGIEQHLRSMGRVDGAFRRRRRGQPAGHAARWHECAAAGSASTPTTAGSAFRIRAT